MKTDSYHIRIESDYANKVKFRNLTDEYYIFFSIKSNTFQSIQHAEKHSEVTWTITLKKGKIKVVRII